MKTLDELGTGKDHHQTHNERHKNAPKEHAVLVFFRNLEIAEDQQENKKVVDRERQLDQIAGEKFLCLENRPVITTNI